MKKTPAQIKEYLETHCPNRKERQILEARYRKKLREDKKKKPAQQIKRLPWWKKLFNFCMRKY